MVRVISGSAGGLKLKTLDSDETRPTLDRVKEAMFSILTPFIPGRRVLDLFSGSGALGIEALSRGAAYCCFNDIDRRCAAVIRENIAHTRFEDRSQVLSETFMNALSTLRAEGQKFGLLLLDPPYGGGQYEKAILTAERYGLFDDDCVIMCEHSRDVPFPDRMGGSVCFRRKEYGTVGLTFYMKGGEEIGDSQN